ncbi:MAG: hypothetical protein V9E96_13775 [Chitinophagaceae bacterium]
MVLINPPYAEATNADNTGIGEENQKIKWSCKNKICCNMLWKNMARQAMNYLLNLLARVAQEIPTATISYV